MLSDSWRTQKRTGEKRADTYLPHAEHVSSVFGMLHYKRASNTMDDNVPSCKAMFQYNIDKKV